jgi:hypothetical protein
MPSKTPATIAVILTVILLILLAILSVLIQMLAFNGASQSQGGMAMGISLGCQGVTLILAAIFARWMTNLLISKFNWNKVLSVALSVMAGTFIGAVISFASIFISALLAGIN